MRSFPETEATRCALNSHLYEVNETSATGTSLDSALYGEQRHGYEYEYLDDTTGRFIGSVALLNDWGLLHNPSLLAKAGFTSAITSMLKKS
ncbi:MAG: hypothetical protein MRQ09_05805 [Candidatus Midichloria sp.]|nr:hypothetical protein [Candidatus Midichloria sp.]